MDPTTKSLITHAKSDLDVADAILATASAGGRKPTVAQLNDIMAKIDNARTFLKAALSDGSK